MTGQEVPEQLELGLDLWEPVAAPVWAAALEQETEGNQDTGFWGA